MPNADLTPRPASRPTDRVLVLNCGSSSVKYRLLEVPDDEDRDGGARPASAGVLASGLVERIGEGTGRLTHRVGRANPGSEGAHRSEGAQASERSEGAHRSEGADGSDEHVTERPIADHAAALDAVLAAFADHGPALDDGLLAVGHRVVHGGEHFSEPTIVDEAVLHAIDDLAALAPLHNPACATGIRAARDRLPGAPQVAVFDTAFHRDLPVRARTYAVPARWREHLGVRRYGFHGTSHAYVSRRTALLLRRPLADVATIVLHLGNGASACAVDGGRSIDTSMGLTPLAGLVMGTRSGDVDPALPEYLNRVAGLSPAEVDDRLNHDGGLLALAGVSDVRAVTERAAAGDAAAEQALDVYCYRIRTYVGAYLAALGRLDAVAFTAGVGEHSALVRRRSLAGLERLGIAVDDERNGAPGGGERVISPDGAPVTVLVVPTDEEREIARQAADAVRSARDGR